MVNTLLFFAVYSLASLAEPPHLPLEASSGEILAYSTAASVQSTSDHPAIVQAIKVGSRNHQWLGLINSGRAQGEQLSFTSPGTQGGYPVEAPLEYSPNTIGEKLVDLRRRLPAAMIAVLFGDQPLTPTLPVAAEEFLKWGRLVDVSYQMALRWNLMLPHLPWLTGNRHRDIRGYYFFSRMTPETRQDKLANPAAWTAAERGELSDWLLSLCFNSPKVTLSTCQTQIQNTLSRSGDFNPLFSRWLEKSREVFNSFFVIPTSAMRTDLRPRGARGMEVPFRDPKDQRIREFLASNIEEEWRLGSWRLTLAFSDLAAIWVQFLPETNPSVDRLGGDVITMNSSQPLSEYDAQWMIRHEFGHTLGIPDCYIEYYEERRGAMVSYQIDVENLMCSRKGRFQKIHLDELKRYQ